MVVVFCWFTTPIKYGVINQASVLDSVQVGVHMSIWTPTEMAAALPPFH
jgi:hypothetical protein